MGFEPMMRVLQTLALPLGDVAVVDLAVVQPREREKQEPNFTGL